MCSARVYLKGLPTDEGRPLLTSAEVGGSALCGEASGRQHEGEDRRRSGSWRLLQMCRARQTGGSLSPIFGGRLRVLAIPRQE